MAVSERRIRRVARAVVVLCLAVLGLTVAGVAVPSMRQWAMPPSAEVPAYAVGDVFDMGHAVSSSGTGAVLVFFRADCQACLRSQDALRAIRDRAAEVGLALTLVSPIGDHDAAVRFVQDAGLGGAHLVELDLASTRITAVPTVIVVDAASVVRFVRQGEVVAGESSVLDFLKRMAPAAG